MKKKRTLMRLSAMTLAFTMIMGMSMVAFATENNGTNSGETEATCEFATAEECTKDDCPVHKKNTDADENEAEVNLFKEEDSQDNKAGKEKAVKEKTVSGNTASDKDDAQKERKDMDKVNGTDGNLTAETKDAGMAVKTGETDIVPLIIGLAVIAAGAGGIYVLYRKKQK